ncbi:unnamed protein product [Ixodes hexagonus]
MNARRTFTSVTKTPTASTCPAGITASVTGVSRAIKRMTSELRAKTLTNAVWELIPATALRHASTWKAAFSASALTMRPAHSTVITWEWSGSTERCGPSDRALARRVPAGTASWTVGRHAATARTLGRTSSAVRSVTDLASVSIRRLPSSLPMGSAGSTSARFASACLARWTAGAWSARTWRAATPCSVRETAARTARTTPVTRGPATGRGPPRDAPTWGASTRRERGCPSLRTLAPAASAQTDSSAACTLQIALAMLALWHHHKALFTTRSRPPDRARENVPQKTLPGSRLDASPNRSSLEEQQQPQRQRQRHPA